VSHDLPSSKGLKGFVKGVPHTVRLEPSREMSVRGESRIYVGNLPRDADFFSEFCAPLEARRSGL